MRLTFFLLQFPVASETFVLNQIIYFIEQGHQVDILSVLPGDLTQCHAAFHDYQLLQKTRYLLPAEGSSRWGKLRQRCRLILPMLLHPSVLCAGQFWRYGDQAKRLLLPAIAAQLCSAPLYSDIFLAHFGYAGVLANKLRQLKLLHGRLAVVFHGADISRRHILREHQHDYPQLFADGELLLPVSEHWQRKLIALGCPPEKIQVIRMGIALENYPWQPRQQLRQPLRLITVARLTEKKGLAVAIAACAQLKQRGIHFHYHIVGEGEQRQALAAQIQQADLADHVTLLGFCSQEKTRQRLAQADLFLLPSQTAADGDMEGIPVALMEAMATGLPVVSTEHSGIPELISHATSGWLIAERDVDALAALLEQLACGQGDITAIVTAARRQIETQFNQQIAYGNLAQVLESRL